MHTGSYLLCLVPVLILLLPVLAVGGSTESVGPADTDPPGQCRILSEGDPITIPFEVYRGDIRFKCRINGRDAHMLLDDGYMWDELLFWGGPRVDSFGLAYDGEIGVGGGSGDAEELLSKTAYGITVTFPGVEFTDQRAVVIPSGSGPSTWWSGSEGQVSAMFFKHFVVDINFDSMKITLIRPDEFTYGGDGVPVTWEPLEFGPWSIPATITVSDGRDIPLKLFMDLGYNDQLQVWTGRENNIAVPEEVLPAGLGMNVQGVKTFGYIGRLPHIAIGGYELDNVLVSYVSPEDSKQARSEAMIGLGLLSRFNLVFDYSRRRLFVAPNGRFGEPFEYDMSGMWLRRNENRLLEIVTVHDDSPASDAGLQTGDLITHIDNSPSEGLDIFDVRSLFRQEGKNVKLVIRRDGEDRQITLVLRRLL